MIFLILAGLIVYLAFTIGPAYAGWRLWHSDMPDRAFAICCWLWTAVFVLVSLGWLTTSHEPDAPCVEYQIQIVKGIQYPTCVRRADATP